MIHEPQLCFRQGREQLIQQSRCKQFAMEPSRMSNPRRAPSRTLSGNVICVGIYCIDWLLRCWYGVYAYSKTDNDLLRVSIRRVETPTTLSDGTRVHRGDVVVDLHIWNERIPALGPLGPSLVWASRTKRRIELSLVTLAHHLESQDGLDRCAAVRAEVVFVSGQGARKLEHIAEHYGLTPAVDSQRADLGHGLLAYGLAWACNPESLNKKRFRPMRYEFWISGVAFRERYMGAREAHSNQSRPGSPPDPVGSIRRSFG
jgi:hypothetical protein